MATPISRLHLSIVSNVSSYDQQKHLLTASFNSIYDVYISQFAALYSVRRSAMQFLHVAGV